MCFNPLSTVIPSVIRHTNVKLFIIFFLVDSQYCYRANDTKFNGRCSTFCLPVPGGKTCQCEEKVSLTDGFNCDNGRCKNILIYKKNLKKV